MEPKSCWQWYIDDKTNHLALALDDELHFITAYNSRLLRPGEVFPQAFSVDHCEQFYALRDKVEQGLPALNRPQQLQVVLNAVAAGQFHKSVAMKSWFYNTQSLSSIAMTTPSATIETPYDRGQVLVLEQQSQSLVCMLVTGEMQLNEHKTLASFSLIRVAPDRLKPLDYIAATVKSA